MPRLPFVLFVTLLLLAGACLCVPTFDYAVSRWFMQQDFESHFLFRQLYKQLMLVEIFGQIMGGAILMAAIFLLDPDNRRNLPRFLAMILTPSLVAAVLKSMIGRYRPRVFFDEEFFNAPADTIWRSFHYVETLDLPWKEFASIPSGHSTFAWSLAVALIWLYPKGRFLFLALALAVMLQRVVSVAHFPSDTLAGAAVGFLVASLFLPRQKTTPIA